MHKTLLLTLIPYAYVWGQADLSAIGARSWGLGNAMSALPQAQSFFYNPAGLDYAKHSFVNSSFESRFNIPALSTVSISANFKKKWATLAIGGQRYGDHRFQKYKFGIAIGRKLSHVSLGLKLSLLGQRVKNTSSNNTLQTEFGVMARLSPAVRIGFHAINLTSASLSAFDRLPTQVRLGITFQPIKKIIILTEAEYIVNQLFFFKAGLEYLFLPKLYLRTGLNSGIGTQHFGVGYIFQKWCFDYSVNTHPTLGLSHHMSMNINFQSKTE